MRVKPREKVCYSLQFPRGRYEELMAVAKKKGMPLSIFLRNLAYEKADELKRQNTYQRGGSK